MNGPYFPSFVQNLKMAAGSPRMSARRNSMSERMFMEDLNTRFQGYTDRVRELKDQCKKIENSTFLAHTNALENEIEDLQRIYESKIADLSNRLEDTIAERNTFQLESGKFHALYDEYNSKHKDESTNRKKLENALADAHRLLSEKDACIQDCRITIAQHQNAHLETSKERDTFLSNLTNTQINYDNEMKVRKDCEAQCQKLSDELDFRNKIHHKELVELNNKLVAAERAIEMADEELKKHEDVDDNLANMIAKIRIQTENEMRRYQQESETNYQTTVQDFKNKLDSEINRRSQAEEETIQVKAIIEEMNAKIAKLEAKSASVEEQNNSLISTLQAERQAAANVIRELEGKVNELSQKLHENRQELTATQNSIIPFDTELQGFHSLLDAEEKRLNILLTNQPSELVRTANGELLSSRNPYTARRSLPGSPRRIAESAVASAVSQRAKSVSVAPPQSAGGQDSDGNQAAAELPPLKNAPASPKYWNVGGDSSRKIYSTRHACSGSPTTRVFYKTSAYN